MARRQRQMCIRDRPSEEEDEVTRKFYRDLSHLSKNTSHKRNKSNLIQQIIKVITGRGGSPK